MTAIAVIGAGAFGTALSCVMASDGTETVLWSRRADQADAINTSRENRSRLPGHKVPQSLRATSEISDLSRASCVLLVLPAQETEVFLAQHANDLPEVTRVFCAKGITQSGHRLQTELVADRIPSAVLTGPGFATEIASGKPTALTLASRMDGIEALQARLSRPCLRLYRSDDIIGAQLGGALKNVIAIAAGIAIGSGLGESARAAIVTRGFSEMCRLARAMGAKDDTLTGLSGFGDLVLTCTSEKSRNFAHGMRLGAQQATKSQTTEGIATAAATLALARRHDVEMPVAAAVTKALENPENIPKLLVELLSRPLRAE